jgi:hypothetical protein
LEVIGLIMFAPLLYSMAFAVPTAFSRVCASEAGINAGGHPTRRIRLFTTEKLVHGATVRPGRKQDRS